MQFRGAKAEQVRAARPAKRSSSSDRDCPLDTARDRCLWHVGGTAGTNEDVRTWRRRLQLGRKVRRFPGVHCIVGKSPQGSRQLGGSLHRRSASGRPVA
jgi:hypothetical protein